jgi:hypothetical protein
MGAINKGIQAIASSRSSERCGSLNARGLPCGAWSLRGSVPPRCRLHAALDAGVAKAESEKAIARKRQKAALKRAEREAARRGPSVPLRTHQDVLRQLADAEARLRELHRRGLISDRELPVSYPAKPLDPFE